MLNTCAATQQRFYQHYAMIIASGASIPLPKVYNRRLCNRDNKKFCCCFLAPFIAILCLSFIKSVLVQWLSAFWTTLHSNKRQVWLSGNWATLVMCQKEECQLSRHKCEMIHNWSNARLKLSPGNECCTTSNDIPHILFLMTNTTCDHPVRISWSFGCDPTILFRLSSSPSL